LGTHAKRGECAKVLIPFVYPLQFLLCRAYAHVMNDDGTLVIREFYSVRDEPLGVLHKFGILGIKVTFLIGFVFAFCLVSIGEILYKLQK